MLSTSQSGSSFLKAALSTFTGNKATQIIEPLVFEQDRPCTGGVRLPQVPAFTSRLGSLERSSPIGLPSLSEPTVMRHYHRLSRKNYAIEDNMYNPRVNEAIARIPGFADIHPLQPESSTVGAREALTELGGFLLELTGLAGVSLAGASGAHGEHIGLMAIRAAHIKSGEDEKRRICLIPDSAHGTNPASAAMVGYDIVTVKSSPDGCVDVEDLKKKLSDKVACVMITNPNTLGIFETRAKEIADLVHSHGGYVYMDAANFNAIIGRVQPSALGVDALHFNVHKTMSTPHGMGGPGAGPTCFSAALTPFMPAPAVVRKTDAPNLPDPEKVSSKVGSEEFVYLGQAAIPESFGKVKGFHGNFGINLRALGWLKAVGQEGIKLVSGDAVLNANYLLSNLKQFVSAPFGKETCMHECLFDDSWLKGTGVTTMDVAKKMIDEGYHPPTVYFPLVVSGAMLVEPTESENKATLDNYINVVKNIAEGIKKDDKFKQYLKDGPHHTPVKRVDELNAAKNPILRVKN
ncbi:hypothetical protein RCL1_005170 [Eukaryota sp. TZLM3-RCL]